MGRGVVERVPSPVITIDRLLLQRIYLSSRSVKTGNRALRLVPSKVFSEQQPC